MTHPAARFTIPWMAALVIALPALADTIVLKNGRRIVGVKVVEEHNHVSYETRAGWLRLPRSIVSRIEKGEVALAADRAADLGITAPPLATDAGYAEVAARVARGGGVDLEYLSGLEAAAQGGSAAAVSRVAVAHHAAAQARLRNGQTEQAIDHYRRALSFAPGQAGLLLQISYLHLRRGGVHSCFGIP